MRSLIEDFKAGLIKPGEQLIDPTVYGLKPGIYICNTDSTKESVTFTKK